MSRMIQKTPGGNNDDERRAGSSYTANERMLIDDAYNRLSEIEATVGANKPIGPQTIDGGNAFSRP